MVSRPSNVANVGGRERAEAGTIGGGRGTGSGRGKRRRGKGRITLRPVLYKAL